MTPERLAEIRTLILSVKQDSLTLGDTRINMLVVDPNALVRAMDDLLTETVELRRLVEWAEQAFGTTAVEDVDRVQAWQRIARRLLYDRDE